jgi:hypothetical protein
MNQHANILNALSQDVVTKCPINDITSFFIRIARSYPAEYIVKSMEQITRIVEAKSKARSQISSSSSSPKQRPSSQMKKANSKNSPRKTSLGALEISKVKSAMPGTSPKKLPTPKEALKDSADEINQCMTHIAEQLIFLSQNIVRIEKIDLRQDEEIDMKLYKREFDSMFKAESNRLTSAMDNVTEKFSYRIQKLDEGSLPNDNII